MRRPRPNRPARKRHRHAEPGAAPGTLISAPGAAPPALHLMAYGGSEFHEARLESAARLADFRGRYRVLWLDVEGVGHVATLEQIGAAFGLHHLALEDVTHTAQRAKFEAYDDHDFIVARMVYAHEGAAETEQLALFLGPDFVLTFQDGKPHDCFDPLRERLRKRHGRIRDLGADYLAYSILDAVVDSHFPALERISDRLDEIEDQVLVTPTRDAAMRIHSLKRELLTLRRATWPLREVFNVMTRDESPRICGETRLFLRDCYDHVVRQMDLIETYREMCADMMDLYLSGVSQRMNEVMKVLTLIATIFLPLTFIAGVYGMNFDPDASPWNMPELRWYLGYPLSLALMAATTIGMLVYFRRKGWIGAGRKPGHGGTPPDGGVAGTPADRNHR